MMQISEYFIWKGQDTKKDKSASLGTRASLIFNITQPLVVFLCLILISKVKMSFKIIASIVVLFYVSFMLINLNKQTEYKSLKPSLVHLNSDFTKLFCIPEVAKVRPSLQ